MKNIIKSFAIIGIVAAGLACEKKSSNDEPQTTTATPTAEFESVQRDMVANAPIAPTGLAIVPLPATGNVVTMSTVIDRQSNVGETPAGKEAMTWEEIISTYPDLADRVTFLAAIDKVVETDARTIDLYSAGSVVMTLKYNEASDALVVVNSSHAGFAADLINFETTAVEQSQGAIVDTLDFMMSSCRVAKTDVPQEQAQVGKEAPSKEAPTKEEPKIEEPKKECAAIIASLVLKQVVEKIEQKQEAKEMPKEEPKAVEQKQEEKTPESAQKQG